jgi:hypothetical protein
VNEYFSAGSGRNQVILNNCLAKEKSGSMFALHFFFGFVFQSVVARNVQEKMNSFLFIRNG